MTNQSYVDRVLDYLEILTSFKGTKRTGMEGYHDYYEQAGYAETRIMDMGAYAVDGLTVGLESPNAKIRKMARRILTEINNQHGISPALINRLTQKLHLDDVEIRIDTVRQLGKYKNQTLFLLLQALQDSNENVRAEAASVIGMTLRNNAQVVHPLIDLLQVDESPQVRANIAFALGENKTQRADIVFALLNHALDETDNHVRDIMFTALMTNPNAAAVPVLMANLNQPALESWIVSAISRYGNQGFLREHMINPAIEWMNRVLSSNEISPEQAKNLNSMSAALATVGTLKAAVPILKLIEANIVPYSHYAIEHLAQISDIQVTLLLHSLLDSDSADIRLRVAQRLNHDPSPEALEALQNYAKKQGLTDEENDFVQQILTNTSEQDPLASFKADLKSNKMSLRNKALRELAQHEQGLPLVVEVLQSDGDHRMREKAAESLGSYHKRTEELVPILIKVMQSDTNTSVRKAAIMALAFNKTQSKAISDAVLERITHETQVGAHDAILYALTKHPNPDAVSYVMEKLPNKKLSLRVVRLLHTYVQRSLVTANNIAPAIDWMNDILTSDVTKLDKEQQAAISELGDTLALLDIVEAVDPILKLIQADLKKYSLPAIQYLTRISDKDAMRALLTLLNNKQVDFRQAAIKAIESSPSPIAGDALTQHITRDDIDEDERNIAKRVLEVVKQA